MNMTSNLVSPVLVSSLEGLAAHYQAMPPVAALVDAVHKQGRVSIRLKAHTLLTDGGVAATYVGRYVAIAKP